MLVVGPAGGPVLFSIPSQRSHKIASFCWPEYGQSGSIIGLPFITSTQTFPYFSSCRSHHREQSSVEYDGVLRYMQVTLAPMGTSEPALPLEPEVALKSESSAHSSQAVLS